MSRFGSLKNLVLTLAVFGLVSIAASTARADIVVTTGVNNQGTDNVLLNPATNVLTVTGVVGANNLLVNFTSTSGSGLLNANPSGQATVSGGTGNTALTQLTFGLANNDTFTRAVFNINASTGGSVVIHVEGVNINGNTTVRFTSTGTEPQVDLVGHIATRVGGVGRFNYDYAGFAIFSSIELYTAAICTP